MEPYSIQNSAHGDAVRAVQQAALAAVDPGAAVHRHVEYRDDLLTIGGREYDLADLEQVWVVGGGKAATAMVAALNQILGYRLGGGVVVTKYDHADPGLDTGPVEVVEAGHPLPDDSGVQGTKRMADLLASATERDLVLVVLSGGGSALLTLPSAGLDLADLQETTDLLLRAGATIVELNTVRKHLS
jgi:hydroxypyruvate reductase